MRRKFERQLEQAWLPWAPTHPVFRSIRTGSRWFYAWLSQAATPVPVIEKRAGIAQARLQQLDRGATPTELEVAQLAELWRCPADDFRASIALSEQLIQLEKEDQEQRHVCNLYKMRRTTEEVGRLFKARVSGVVEVPDGIYPKAIAPVIIQADGERRLGGMRWGFSTEVAGKTKVLTKHVTNARNLDSGLWRNSFARRRCLVPFTEFAEPKRGRDSEGRPAQHWFTVTDQPVACFAGLWRNTREGPVFAFCTTEPNALIEPLHPKAMPVILMPDDHDAWLTGSAEEARKLQAPYPSQLMSVDMTA